MDKTGNRNKKKRDVPVTGILIGAVLVLAVCVVILGWMVFGMERRLDSAQQGAGKTQQVENGTGQMAGTEAESKRDGNQDALNETAENGQNSDLSKPETEERKYGESGFDNKEETQQTENGTMEESGKESESEVLITEDMTDRESENESEYVAKSQTETEKLVVAIDPGHQGSWVDMSEQEPNAPGSSEMKAKATTGTQGRFSGKAEYELNLEVSLLLRDELEARGYEVIMTREDHDTAISNSERALMAYDEGGDIYVRIHANGSDDSSVSGALAMVPSSSNPYVGYLAEDSYLLADCILKGYCEAAQFESLGIQYYDNMTGINWSKLPVMILEMGFMTNESDDLRMADVQVQEKMAEGIADGIDRYFEQKGMKREADSEKTDSEETSSDGAVSDAAESGQTVSEEASAQMDAVLERVGEDYLYPAMDAGEQWAVSIADLDTGAAGNINGDVPMKSASIIKVFIMAAIYDRVCYPSSEAEYIPIPETYEGELKQLITDMITVSDNTASNTLLEALGQGDAQAGMDVVNQFCEKNGYTATKVGRKFLESNPTGDNYTSVNDCCRLLQSIYEGTCVNAEASAKMYEYLKNQTRTGKIPAGLSGTSAVVANKTGELYGEYGDVVENDIAIVEDGDSAYILCVMSGSLNDNAAAVARIANISQLVYEAR